MSKHNFTSGDSVVAVKGPSRLLPWGPFMVGIVPNTGAKRLYRIRRSSQKYEYVVEESVLCRLDDEPGELI